MDTDGLRRQLLRELEPRMGEGEAASVARLLLEDLLGHRRGQRPRALSEEEVRLAAAALARLKEGEPVQYVTGVADFYGLRLQVSPAVLIPRPETEELVAWILEDHGRQPPLRLLDIGTGSGCIPLAVKSRRPGWECTGVDVSPEALAVARGNARDLDLPVTFRQADALSEGLNSGAYNVLVSNPPYIPPSERERMGRSTLDYEPGLALFVPEPDPLVFYRRIAELGTEMVGSGGTIYLETNEFNNAEVAALFAGGGAQVQRRRDMQGKWRMIRVG